MEAKSDAKTDKRLKVRIGESRAGRKRKQKVEAKSRFEKLSKKQTK